MSMHATITHFAALARLPAGATMTCARCGRKIQPAMAACLAQVDGGWSVKCAVCGEFSPLPAPAKNLKIVVDKGAGF